LNPLRLPGSASISNDVHNDFRDLSLTMVEFGFGADADIAARVYFTKALFGQVGYRVWWNRIIDGT